MLSSGFFLFLSRFLSMWVSLLVVCVCLSLASTSDSFVHCELVVRVYVWVWLRFGYGVSSEFNRYYSTRGWGSLLVVCVFLSLSLFLASIPGSFVQCVLVVQVYVWVGHGVSGDFSSYFPTRGWGRLKTRSPFDITSSEHFAFVTCLDLFWFPHWFEWGAFCDRNLSHWIMTRERMGTLGGNRVCFRKSLSQTFNLIKLDFSSFWLRFPIFVVSSPHNCQLGTHTNGLKGSLEAPDSKTLPQWILNLRVYAHICRQIKEI